MTRCPRITLEGGRKAGAITRWVPPSARMLKATYEKTRKSRGQEKGEIP